MTSWKIGLPMYYGLAAPDHANLLNRIAIELRARNFREPVELLTGIEDLDAFWSLPDLLLGQACGYPLVTRLAKRVKLLGTPHYRFPWCDSYRYRSLLVVRLDSGLYELEDLRGTIAAVNQWHSHSGMNAFRLAIAPHAGAGRYFRRVLESGSHRESLALVRRRLADVAAIDCVTCGYLRLHEPRLLRGLRVLAETEAMPGLPLVASQRVDDGLCALLRDVLTAAFSPAQGGSLATRLHLGGFTQTTMDDYARIAEAEWRAAAQGYPVLA
jgi:ABC-type phosphate/phosphonate transport system substrate-binding protein